MKTYEFKPNRKPYYVFWGIFLVFTALTILFLWLFLVTIPKEAELSLYWYGFPLFFGVLAVFALHSMRNVAKPPKIILSEEAIYFEETNEKILWKNIIDVYPFMVGLEVNHLAFRTVSDAEFTLISTGNIYSLEVIDKFQEYYLQARTQEVLQQIQNGKTAQFQQASFGLSFLPDDLQISSTPIYLNKNELIIDEKQYKWSDLATIPKEKFNIIHGKQFHLTTKNNSKILSFNRTEVLSAEVFKNVVNELVK